MNYSIGELADLTGVKPGTLRAWENRYDLVHPARTTSSYRQYSDHDVEVLTRMRVLVDSGIPARRAAAMTKHTPPAAEAGKTGSTQSQPGLQDITAVARAGATLDAANLRQVLDEAFAIASIEAVVDQWLLPSMREVGHAWAAGKLDEVSEHVISAAVMRKLSSLFEATPARGPRVVVGLPAGARHELPALAFALLLQRAGAQVLYVGADVPEPCWTRLVEVWRPRAAVIAATCEADVAAATAAVTALSNCGVAPVYAGGSAAQNLEGAIPLPAPLSDAAEAVATAVLYRDRRSASVTAH